jgi:uncharacterized protein YjeT (DUF2065 family)
VDAALLLALGLFFLIEGLVPFLMPERWRDFVRRMSALSDGQLRFVGLLAVAVGLGLIGLSELK